MYSRTHGIPAVFSFFFPGFGQLVKGHLFKAFAIWLIGGTLMFIFWWTIFVPLGIWIWNVYDAYSTNRSI